MKGKWIALLLMSCSFLEASSKEDLALQELKIQNQDFSYQLNHQKVEIDILHEKIKALESAANSSKRESSLADKDRLALVEKKLSSLEKVQETLLADLKLLKNHVNEACTSIATNESKLSELDKHAKDIKGIKSSLESMISLLQKNDVPTSDKTYVVKPGDSLGKIAQENHIDIKKLKEANSLSGDRIFPGQKLNFP